MNKEELLISTEELPLSYAQQRLWFLDQLEGKSALYNIPVALRLVGMLNRVALEQSLQEIIARHEALRTNFQSVDGQTSQIIHTEISWTLSVVDLTHLSTTSEQEIAAHELVQQKAIQPFDLAKDSLIKATLIVRSQTEHILFICMHHIVSDGWSMGVLMQELAALYDAYSQDKSSTPLAPLEIQYADFALWQREYLQGDVLDTQLSYWKKQLADAVTFLPLPTDKPRPAVQSLNGAYKKLTIPPQLCQNLTKLSQKQGVTLFMTLLAAFNVLLSRYSGQLDILVGTPIANRNQEQVEGLIGFFVNTLVLRADLSENPSFEELLAQVRSVALGAYSHQDLPLEMLVEALQPERNLSHTPLFQVMFSLEDSHLSGIELTGLSISSFPIKYSNAQFDLSLSMENTADGLVAYWVYNTDLFDNSTVERMASHFVSLLEGIVANPQERIAQLPLLTSVEEHQLLVDWNNTQTDYDDNKCIHQLFEEQVERTPDNIAVLYDNRKLTYRELNSRANQLAHYLQSKGVGADVLVGICVERSLEMIIGMLGVLKAGGAYLPIDPNYPIERVSFMLEDSQVSLLLTQERLIESLPKHQGQFICLDSNWQDISQGSDLNLTNNGITAENLAYIIYTSGSTGKPKGVMIEHQSLVNFTQMAIAEYGLSVNQRMLQFSSISFDPAMEEIYPTLTCGGTLVLRTEEMLSSVQMFIQKCQEWDINAVSLPTAYWHELTFELVNANLQLPPSLRVVIIGGEQVIEQRLRMWQEYVAEYPQLINTYGPTEATVAVSICKCPGSTTTEFNQPKASIGKPIQNVRIHILDTHLQPVPIGVAGELHIGGVCLSRGYLNRADLTQEKFIPNPFQVSRGAEEQGSRGEKRLYKTGDLARYLGDGSIQYLGRIDNQVKIRGFRIELGEIETVLNQFHQIQLSTVIVREDIPGDKRLVAYIVGKKEITPNIKEIRQFIKAKLPEYMIPSAFVLLEFLPLTPSGKIDRRGLPAPDLHSQGTEKYVAPQNPTEEILSQIWAQVLKVELVGINDNFFELGGHSLLATQLVSAIRKVFFVELPLRELFAAPTVAELAQEIEQLRQTDLELSAPAILPREKDAQLPLSFAQQRLWFLDQFQPNSALYNIPIALRISGNLNQVALEKSLQEIILRHEALRTNLITVDEQATQIVHTDGDWGLSVVNLQDLSTSDGELVAQQLVQEKALQPFDLASEPLVRASIIVLSETEQIFVLCMHHIVSDGWSTGVFLKELALLYNAYTKGESVNLDPLPIQYGDFAIWQRQWLQGDVLQHQLSYWNEQLKDAPTLLSLTTDRARPAVQSFAGAYEEFALSIELTQKLVKLSQEQGVTLFMTLLAAFDILLYRYTDVADIKVGTPIANRNRSEIEGLIGFFVNTLVMRSDLSGNPSFSELLVSVREMAMNAYAHQDLPFEMLVEALQPERDLSHAPLFQVMFILQNAPMSELELSGLSVSPIKLKSGTAPFDITLAMENTDNGLVGVWEYNTDLFDPSTIERMKGNFITLLEAIVANPLERIEQLPILTPVEQQKILVEWNDTGEDYPRDKSIHELFEEQVELSANAVAVVFENEGLTYQQLNQQANQLAHHLKSLGVKAEDCVGIYLERSLSMIVALLAVLKTGGAYVPLDPDYPHTRLADICLDSQINLVITQETLLNSLPAEFGDIIVLDKDSGELNNQSQSNPLSEVRPENLACILYTSGSTGKPKGVMLTHSALVNHSCAISEVFGLTNTDRVLQFASLGFDVAAEEIFPTWFKGGTVVLRPLQMFADFSSFAQFIEQQKLSVLNITPAYWHEWAIAVSKSDATVPQSLKLVAVGGDAVLPETVTIWQQIVGDRVKCLNVYGPTEASVTAIVHDLLDAKSSKNSVLIGRPIANTQAYILDADLQPVPIGVIGELHIGGVRLARGYLNRPELTEQKFLSNPFIKGKSHRIYKTGDLARYLGDGKIECFGRIDNQVKIRGFRIELGEIEAVLNQHSQVQTSCVLLREDNPGDKRLVAYVVADDEEIPATQLRQFLSNILPLYMVPSTFCVLDSLPLTANRKVDRRALPVPDYNRDEQHNYIAPRTPTEEILASIWAQVLKLEQVGIDDNFFTLGGHSLLATQLVSRIRNRFKIELPLRSIFAAATVAGLADLIGQLQPNSVQVSSAGILPRAENAEIPLSFAQQRLWFLEKLQPLGELYNIPLNLRIEGSLNQGALAQSLKQIIQRHEGLRTNLIAVDGKPTQVIQTQTTWELSVVELQHLPPREKSLAQEQLLSENFQPFCLETESLFRAKLLVLSDTEYILTVCMHHIISDDWSMGVFLQELASLYNGYCTGNSTGNISPLAPLKIQYPDFALWQRQWLQGEVLQSQLSYWEQQLKDAPEKLSLPTDRARAAIQSFRGAYHEFALPVELTQKLKQLSQEQGVTLFMTLLAAFDTLLSRYSGVSDILVGTPIANRNRSEIEGLIGFFANTLVMRTDLSENPSFSELLARVREMALAAYAHQDLPFEMLVEALQPQRDLSHTPLFQVAFVLQNAPMSQLEMSGLSISELPANSASSKFDLTLGIGDTNTGLGGVWEYNTDLFDSSTIERMASHFVRLLEAIVANPQQQIDQLPILTEFEQQQLLVDWNNTGVDFPQDKCIHQLFEEQVERTPDAVAVVFEGQQLTYYELNCRANQLANYLQRNHQIKPDTLIGICVERSLEMIVGILGILKAGGAYVPLSPEYPRERLSFMVEDAQISLLLTQQQFLERLPEDIPQLICLETDLQLIEKFTQHNPSSEVRAFNLAYVIYTSGSTGKPKGVMVEHSAVNRLVLNTNYVQLCDRDCVAQAANIAFDAATFEIWGALLHGAKLVIINKSVLLSPQEFAVDIGRNQISVLFLTTALFNQLASFVPQVFSNLRYLLFGGEVVDPSWVQEVLDKGAPQHLLHVYGPTENTTFSSWYLVEELPKKATTIPIGRAISNTQIYLLDKNLQPVPVGVPGELYLGGAGLARGYLNREELTQEKFIPNPFQVSRGKERLYKTGDLARYLPSGEIEYLGRIDNQVKIRGFRIELGEIETALSGLPEVREAVVIAPEEQPNDKRLVAYVVPQPKKLELSNIPQNLSADKVELWPSIAEYYVYDELLYYAMTNDYRRRDSYKVAINKLVKDKVVVEIGTGKDAILSRFCVEGGAKKIYAIERSEEVYNQARACIKKLGLSEKITVIHGDATLIELPELADVCLSAIVGAIGGSEGAAVIINNARRFLKPDGLMIPERSVTKMAAVTLPDEILHNPKFAEIPSYYTQKIFEEVGYPFDLRVCIKKFPQENVLSTVDALEDLKFNEFISPEFSHEVKFEIQKNGRMDGFLVWLNLHTIAGEEIDILKHEYCWLPVYFPLFEPGIKVESGDVIEAVCTRTLCENNLNPDYEIKGRLHKKNGEIINFEYVSYHYKNNFRQTPFYQRLFADYGDNLARTLRANLKKLLPDYMIPSAFMMLEKLPLTANGKVDRRALPVPDLYSQITEKYVAPRTPTEEMVAQIWKEVLKLEQIGIYDHFFEIGGHSLLATQVISRLQEAFETSLPLRSIFSSPTIAQLSQIIEQQLETGLGLKVPQIAPVSRNTDIPLSWAQERLWFMNQLEGESGAYTIDFSARLRGDLNVKALEQAFGEIVQRHEVLRTRFEVKDNKPIQVIDTNTSFTLPVVDLQNQPQPLEQVKELVTAEASKPFDLVNGSVLRVQLWQVASVEYVLLLAIHHIAADGWSMGVLIDEICAYYGAIVTGNSVQLPELEVQYADFALWQRSLLSNQVKERQLSYWKQHLTGAPPRLELPTDRPRPAIQTFRGGTEKFQLDGLLTSEIKKLSQESGSTLFMTLLAAFVTLMSRMSGQTDIVIGSPIANRNRREIEGLIGFFVNSLALRFDLSGEPTFAVLLEQVLKVTQNAYEHQDLPFEMLVEELQPERNLDRNPLIQVVFALQNAPSSPWELPGISVEDMPSGFDSVRVDLEVYLWDTPSGLGGFCSYNRDLFDGATIARMMKHFQTILAAIVANPHSPVALLPLLSETEKHQLLLEWNSTQVDYPQDKCIHQLFEEQVEQTPDAVAVVFGDDSLTYSELNCRANQLAHYLQSLGVGVEVLVGLCVERSVDMIVGLLGILKAGGAYVPLDPEYPIERLEFMLTDAQPQVLLTKGQLVDKLPEHSAELVCLDEIFSEIVQNNQDNPNSEVRSFNLANVIYTSGSTGKPKGVMVEHKGLSNLAIAQIETFGVETSSRVLQFASFSFDACISEILMSLGAGARLYLGTKDSLMPGIPLIERLRDYAITHITLPPSALAVLPTEELPQLQTIIVAGEACSIELIKKWSVGRNFFNGYGPTEASVCASIAKCNPQDDKVTIGRPIANTQIYILDSQLKPVPIGVPGELHIAGVGLARGYLNRTELTNHKFIANPFSSEPDSRLYKTGDLARYLASGEIEYLGRIDNQVKIRGFRIELGEIEAVLKQHPLVSDGVVVARVDNVGDKQLVAYLVPGFKGQVPGMVAQWETEYVSDWQTLYEQSYSQQRAATDDPTFDISGWNSSYTGEAIPEQEMRLWVESTVERILALEPQQVLEIGCGNGLLLSRIAPKCEQYWGADYSRAAIENVERLCRGVGALEKVRLLHQTADNFENIPASTFDTVVLNSVVQYFPSVEYLLQVLEGAMEAIATRGKIFVGDVRNLPLLESYHAAVQLSGASEERTVEQWQHMVEQSITAEEELVIDPRFFIALKQHFPQISWVEIVPKRGDFQNELTQFRYDVTLHIDTEHIGSDVPNTVVPWLNWLLDELSLTEIENQLSQQPEFLAIRAVPNQRVQQALQICEWLENPPGVETVSQLRQLVPQQPTVGINPEQFWQLGQDLGYKVDLSWWASSQDGSYDVVLCRSSSTPIAFWDNSSLTNKPWGDYTNNPLYGKLVQKLVPQVREFIQQKLPLYMVPQAFVLLNALPLTPNGKVDRKALPTPNTATRNLATGFVSPRTQAEAQLAQIWSQVLGVERIGVNDNFFELGGHSLLATQVISRLSEQFCVKLSLQNFFEYPTVGGLSQIIEVLAVVQSDAQVSTTNTSEEYEQGEF